jgi:hypothetical protein
MIAYLSKTFILTTTGLNNSDDNTSAVYYLASQGLTSYSPLKLLSEEEKQTLLIPFSPSTVPAVLDNTQLLTLQPVAADVITAVKALCIAPSQQYLEQANINSTILRVKEVQLSTSRDTLSAETAMAVDSEPTVPPKLLQTLIDKSVNKVLAHQFNTLSLNIPRGAPDTPAGASLKKKPINNNKKQENDRIAAAGRLLAVAQRSSTTALPTTQALAPTPSTKHSQNNRKPHPHVKTPTKKPLGPPAVADVRDSVTAKEPWKKGKTNRRSSKRNN